MRARVLFSVACFFIGAVIFSLLLRNSSVGGEVTMLSGQGRYPAVVSSTSEMFQIGEELIYNVSYAFLDIGQIRIRVLNKFSEGGKTYYKTIANIDSYSGIPFVNFHAIYESHVDQAVFPYWFRGRSKQSKSWDYSTYKFDYERKTITMQTGTWGSDPVEPPRYLSLDTIYQDGLSLYYFARENVKISRRVIIPTIINEEKVRTVINFRKKRTGIEIGAVKYPVDVVEFDGNAEFVGPFGLTGAFEGWFSNDEARVPILAKMKVIIGNIRIELMEWKRDGWEPPQFVTSSNE